jgi:hypothetical protein
MLGFRFVCIFFISSADYVLKVNEGNVSHSTFVCQKELVFSSSVMSDWTLVSTAWHAIGYG